MDARPRRLGLLLVSGLLAYAVVRGTRHARTWWMAAINLLGCALFMVSAIASCIAPATGSILDLAAANWVPRSVPACFFAGVVLLWPT